ncbi:MAG: DUF3892 domain-containing protein [Bacteroidota bacterium]
MAKRITDATSDSKGRTTSVRLSGNKTNTPIETAKRMADRGQIEGAHVVRPKGRKSYLRTNPDGKSRNNIDQLSGDK